MGEPTLAERAVEYLTHRSDHIEAIEGRALVRDQQAEIERLGDGGYDLRVKVIPAIEQERDALRSRLAEAGELIDLLAHNDMGGRNDYGYYIGWQGKSKEWGIATIRRARTFLASSVEQEEPTFDEADEMCPNCVTPWKCNGPHRSSIESAEGER